MATVNIFADLKALDEQRIRMAKQCVERELGERAVVYCSEKRRLAEKAVAEYEPAYVQDTDGTDQWAGVAVTWANGGLLGIPSIDPPQPLHGLLAVLKWRRETLEREGRGDTFEEWMRHVVKVVRPINAMALVDQGMVQETYMIRTEDMAQASSSSAVL